MQTIIQSSIILNLFCFANIDNKNTKEFSIFFNVILFFLFNVIKIIEIIFGDWYINNPMLFKLDDLILKRNVQYIFKTNGLYDNNGKQIKYVRDYYGLREFHFLFLEFSRNFGNFG